MVPASEVALPDRYRVTGHIASGGMASVWEAEDQLLGRVVAVKVIAQHIADDAITRGRFQREARAAAQVSAHPNVVTIYDIGEHGDRAFMVMEHFAGGSVADRLRSGGGISRETALDWLRQAAAGLDVAHAAGIVHRDVKPGNLLLDRRGRLAVADFGIARLADDTSVTQTGQVLGTAAYLSPEQATGRPATAASDRYALAVVAYELLTGERPFRAGAAAAQARQHMEAQPPRASAAASDLPPALDAALARGLAKDPADRPPTASALVGELERALKRETTAPTRSVGRPRRRSAAPLMALGAAALVVVGLLLALAGGDGQPAGDPAADQRAGTPDGRETEAAPAPAGQQPSGEQASPAGRSPAQLNDAGFALIQQGDYATAVAPLQRSVEGYRAAQQTSGLPYAFALYNLGVALNRSGRPAEAIPYLEERLGFDNQRGAVKAELEDARAKLQGGDDRSGKDERDGRGDGPKRGRGRGRDDD